jgi:hypothetical protein
MGNLNLPLLYIDPGTGSMLFSILIGATATLFFLFRALLIKLKVVLSGGRAAASDAAQFVIYNEGAQYWNVFKPALDEFEKNGRELLYLCSARDDPVFSAGYRHIKAEYIGEGNRAFARLNILSAGVVLMTTPGLQVYQLKRSKSVKHYSHVLHAPSDATMYRMFGIDYFDSVLLSGGYQAEDIRLLEKIRGLPEKQLAVVGCTYLDALSEKLKNITPEAEHRFTVLVSPSWGPSGILSRYGAKLLEPLAKTGWRVIVRPHPQSKKSEAAVLETLRKRFEDTPNLEWDHERDNIYSLSKADIMISDFSGIIFDYIFLFDRPVMYVNQNMDLRPYDADDLGENAVEKLWQFKTLKKIGVELKEDDFDGIKDVITRTSDSAELREARRKAKEEAWQYQGEAGKKIYEFMIACEGYVP